MTDREALLTTIYENPEVDAPRLIFADWLDEHGQPDWAEFIRIQVEMRNERRTHDRITPRLDELFLRQKEMFKRPWSELLRRCGCSTIGHYSAGFPTVAFTMSALRFPTDGPELLRWFGVLRRVFFELCSGSVELVLSQPAIDSVRYLGLQCHLDDTPATASDLVAIRTTTALDNLIGLEIKGRGTNSVRTGSQLCATLRNARMPRLKELRLSAIRIRDAGIRHLVAANWPNLRFLEISAAGLTDSVGDRLTDSEVLGQLDQLKLAGNRFSGAGRQSLMNCFGNRVDFGFIAPAHRINA